MVCSAKSFSEQRGCKQLNVGLSAKTTVKTASENERSKKLKGNNRWQGGVRKIGNKTEGLVGKPLFYSGGMRSRKLQ